MEIHEHFDVIIIGSGAGGGTLFHHPSHRKKNPLLERGEYLPREENRSSEDVFVKGRYHAKEPWVDKDGREFHPGIHYFVGGNTKVYGAALLRMRERDFTEVKHHGEYLLHGRSATRIWSPTIQKPNSCTMSMEIGVEILRSHQVKILIPTPNPT
jgi:choline dehydrogenase-like flavoprotein